MNNMLMNSLYLFVQTLPKLLSCLNQFGLLLLALGNMCVFFNQNMT